MPHDEPEITQIAKFISIRLPREGIDREQAIDAWRGALRYARKAGFIDEVVAQLKEEVPDDASLHAVLDAART